MSTSTADIANSYPIPSYRFKVSIGQDEMAVTGVSGLELAIDTIEYKDGTGGICRMPGQRQALNITLKRGIFKGRNQLYQWINTISLNQVEKRDISISLTSESGDDLFVTWNVSDAFPTKLSAPNFDATSNEIAIEEITLMADRITVEFH